MNVSLIFDHETSHWPDEKDCQARGGNEKSYTQISSKIRYEILLFQRHIRWICTSKCVVVIVKVATCFWMDVWLSDLGGYPVCEPTGGCCSVKVDSCTNSQKTTMASSGGCES